MKATDEMVLLVLRARLEAIKAAADKRSPVYTFKEAQDFVKEAMPLFVEMRAILRERENTEGKE